MNRKIGSIWKRAVSGERNFCFSFLRFLLHILSFPYLLIFLIFRKIQSIRKVKLPCPIISIGNLTLGGTGKTALTMLISKRLEAMGYKVGIICTGYGGRREGKVNREATPQEFGDEAFLLASGLEKGSVWAGRDRLKMAREALKEGAQVIILDDAMQYFKLHKDLEIVMVNALSPFGYDYLFPRGALREPLNGLQRADVIIVNNANLSKAKKEILFRVAEFNPSATILEADYVPVELLPIPNRGRVNLGWLKEKKILGIAGIGCPEGFQKTLEELAGAVVFRVFPDHHPFNREEVTALQKEALERGCEAVVMTDKDGVKVERLLRENFYLLLPFFVLCVELKLHPEEELWRRINKVLGRET